MVLHLFNIIQWFISASTPFLAKHLFLSKATSSSIILYSQLLEIQLTENQHIALHECFNLARGQLLYIQNSLDIQNSSVAATELIILANVFLDNHYKLVQEFLHFSELSYFTTNWPWERVRVLQNDAINLQAALSKALQTMVGYEEKSNFNSCVAELRVLQKIIDSTKYQ